MGFKEVLEVSMDLEWLPLAMEESLREILSHPPIAQREALQEEAGKIHKRVIEEYNQRIRAVRREIERILERAMPEIG